MRHVIAIGEIVTVNNSFVGMIIEISLKKNSVTYRVQQTTDSTFNTIWAEDWEITSGTKKLTLIRECLLTDKPKENKKE